MKLHDTLKYLLAVLMITATLSGCAINKATSTVDPSADLSGLKSFHVEKYEKDKRDTNVVIEDKLREMGFQVADSKTGVDAVITYKDKWIWDITFYMLELNVSVREPGSGFPLASGTSMHSSLTRKSQEGMVDEVLTNIFFKNRKEGATNAN
ncbi:MAG: hypothetical protein HKP57_04370 [Halobacteria archaeon]|nr:hypothetical protein [Halobacteria archaeon]